MTVTYDITNAIGQVRLNISDIDTTTTTGARSDWTILFTDEEIQIFLDRASSDVMLASVYALLAIASSRALLAKMVKIGDYSQDLKTVADSLRAQAKALVDLNNMTPAGDAAEQAVTDFAARDIIYNSYLRSE